MERTLGTRMEALTSELLDGEAAPNQLPSGYDEDFVTVVEEDF